MFFNLSTLFAKKDEKNLLFREISFSCFGENICVRKSFRRGNWRWRLNMLTVAVVLSDNKPTVALQIV